ncbi:MAG: hypothetical protein RBS46_02030 [Methyloversatilis sp.]|nr:hypothetical protein [Methyloversatilis sp.]
MHTIELRGARLEGAATLRNTLAELLDRLYARDGALDASRLKALVVTDDIAAPAQGQTEAPPLVRDDADDGCTITLAAPYVEQALGGDTDQLLQLVHLLHRELWRSELTRDAVAGSPADALAAQFAPIVARMFDEYRANRASAWSLPAKADLLLPHLLGLLEELPAACQRALADYRLDGNLDALAGISMARLALLMQTTAFSLGYLAGLGRTVADIAPELKAGIDASLLGREWPRIAALLAGASASEGEARTLQLDMLRTRVIAVLAAMGLSARLGEDGAVWMDVADASAEATAAAVARMDTLH